MQVPDQAQAQAPVMPATQDAGGAQSAGPGPDGADAQPAGKPIGVLSYNLAHVLMG